MFKRILFTAMILLAGIGVTDVWARSHETLEKALEKNVALERINQATGETELFNTEDGKYHKVNDKIVKSKAQEEAEEEGIFEVYRREDLMPEPNCVDDNHKTQGYWYYLNELKPGGQYNIKSGNYYGLDYFVIIHTSEVFSTSQMDEWIYTPSFGAFPKSIETLGVYTGGICLGRQPPAFKVKDWSNGDFPFIDYLSNMDAYKISMDDGFGHTQTYFHVLNLTKWLPATNKWVNKCYLFNITTPSGTWDLKYYHEYDDYDVVAAFGGVGKNWQHWAGVLEFASGSDTHPIPLKEVGNKNINRVFDNNIQPLNSSQRAFKQDLIPQVNINRTNIRWNNYTTWTAGATTDND